MKTEVKDWLLLFAGALLTIAEVFIFGYMIAWCFDISITPKQMFGIYVCVISAKKLIGDIAHYIKEGGE